MWIPVNFRAPIKTTGRAYEALLFFNLSDEGWSCDWRGREKREKKESAIMKMVADQLHHCRQIDFYHFDSILYSKRALFDSSCAGQGNPSPQ